MPEILTLPARIRDFIAAPGRFATLATLDPTGAPRQAVVWYRLDPDGTLMVNSAVGRRWPANLRRDARVAIAITETGDGYNWVGLSAKVVEVIDDQAIAQADIADLAHRYHAADPAEVAEDIARFRTQRRVTFRLQPIAFHDHLEP